MRWVCFVLGVLIGAPLLAQEPAPKKKPVAKQQQQQKAHHKPTPEQIRKFNELQKKKQQK